MRGERTRIAPTTKMLTESDAMRFRAATRERREGARSDGDMTLPLPSLGSQGRSKGCTSVRATLREREGIDLARREVRRSTRHRDARARCVLATPRALEV